MAVRNTESKVPQGLTWGDLGQASDPVVHNGAEYVLVSYLTEPLYLTSRDNLTPNTYVVMCKNHPVTEHLEYKWTLSGYMEHHGTWADLLEPIETTEGFFNITWEISRQIICIEFVSELRIKVELSNGEELLLEQDLLPPRKEITDMLNAKQEGSSHAGRKETTEIVAYSYSQYIKQLSLIEPALNEAENRAKRNIIFAILYWTELNKHKYKLAEMLDLWADYINSGNEDDVASARLGVCGLRPVIIPLLTGGTFLDNSAPLSEPLPTVPGESEQDYFKRLFDIFKGIGEDKKIDLFNILRFPKTCIRLCSLVLEKLKVNRPNIASLDWNEIASEPSYIHQLLNDYEYGPNSGRKLTSSAIPKEIADIVLAPYVGLISASNLCDALRQNYYVAIPVKEKDKVRERLQDKVPSEAPRIANISIEVEFGNKNLDSPITSKAKKFILGFKVRLHLDCAYRDQEDDFAIALTVKQYEWRNDESTNPIEYGGLDLIPSDGWNQDLYTRLFLYRRLDSVSYAYARDSSMGPTHIKYELAYEDSNGILDPNPVPAEAIQVFKELFDRFFRLEKSTICLHRPGDHPTPSDIALYQIDRCRELIERWEEIRLQAGYGVVLPQPATMPAEITMQGQVGSPPTELPPPEWIPLSDLDMSGEPLWPELFANKIEYMSPIRIEFKHDKPVSATDGDDVLVDANYLSKIVSTGGAKSEIEEWIEKSAVPKLKLFVRGYADKSFVGTVSGAQYNKNLSWVRASWVKNRIPSPVISKLILEAQGSDPDPKFEGCGDRFAPELPEKNPKYKDVRLILIPDTE